MTRSRPLKMKTLPHVGLMLLALAEVLEGILSEKPMTAAGNLWQ